MSNKKASPELIMEFAKTVCPESPDLFLSMGEKYIFLETIDRIKHLEDQLAEAVRCLEQGKAKYAPDTTNSQVDMFIKRYKEVRNDKDG